MDLGQNRRGVDMGPSAIRYAGLEERLRERISDPSIVVAPLYGAMDMKAQDFALVAVALVAPALWFCRTARYEPPAAAARHPTANPAKTSLLNSMVLLPCQRFSKARAAARPDETGILRPNHVDRQFLHCPVQGTWWRGQDETVD